MKCIEVERSSIRIIKGNITQQSTDAIVNAANTRLAPGGGVAGAIHRAAGPKLWEECKTLHGCDTGEAKITKGYNLKAAYVIHTVGPVYSGSSRDRDQLASCYRNALDLTCKHHLHSISFPAISTGVFGYPLLEAAQISLQTVHSWLQKNKTDILVQFVLFNDTTLHAFEQTSDELLS